MGADFPLLSNEILLPNLVFFRSLLGLSHGKRPVWNTGVLITDPSPR